MEKKKEELYEMIPLYDMQPRLHVSEHLPEFRKVKDPEDMSIMFFRYFERKKLDIMKENVVIAIMDQSHHIIAFNHVSMGSAVSSIVHPREVFKPAIVAGASAIAICHNHPSGELKPSKEDIRITRILADAGKIIGIKLLDHIIIEHHNGEYKSLAQTNSELFA